MQTIQEIYNQSILPLPEEEQLRLASLILEKVTGKDSAPPLGDGDITKFFGTFSSDDPDSADNEKIDRDLEQAYLADHERNSR